MVFVEQERRVEGYAEAMRARFLENKTFRAGARAIYFFAFKPKGLAQLEEDLAVAFRRLGGNFIKLDCTDLSYAEILRQLLIGFGRDDVGGIRDRFETLRLALKESCSSVLLLNPSRMKGAKMRRGLITRELIQFFVDGDFCGDMAANGLVIADVPSFLEANSDTFGHYVRAIQANEEIFLSHDAIGPVPV